MLIGLNRFRRCVQRLGAYTAAVPFGWFLLRAHVVARGARRHGGVSEAKVFHNLCVAWLRRSESRLPPRAVERAVTLAGDVLLLATQPERELIAGSAFFDRLAGVSHCRISERQTRPLMSQEPVPKRGAQGHARGRVCHLVSEIYAAGGHTRVLEDIVRLTPNYEHLVVATDPANRGVAHLRDAMRTGIDCTVIVVEGKGTQQKLESGLKLIEQFAPGTLFSFGHPNDPIVAMLLAAARVPKRIHVHHADHSYSLMPARTDIAVAALFPKAAQGLRQVGIENIVPLYVTCADPERHVGPAPSARGQSGFLTATCGGQQKFRDRRTHRYLDLLRIQFTARDGRHVHIGPLNAETKKAIETLQRELGRSEAFEHVPFTPNLAVALKHLRPDVYLGSYPMGGKRASVEAMAASCPIAAWANEGFHCAADIIYPQHLSYGDISQLYAVLRDFKKEDYDRHAKWSRAYFEEMYSEDRLKTRLAELLAMPIGTSISLQ